MSLSIFKQSFSLTINKYSSTNTTTNKRMSLSKRNSIKAFERRTNNAFNWLLLSINENRWTYAQSMNSVHWHRKMLNNNNTVTFSYHHVDFGWLISFFMPKFVRVEMVLCRNQQLVTIQLHSNHYIRFFTLQRGSFGHQCVWKENNLWELGVDDNERRTRMTQLGIFQWIRWNWKTQLKKKHFLYLKTKRRKITFHSTCKWHTHTHTHIEYSVVIFCAVCVCLCSTPYFVIKNIPLDSCFRSL